MWFSKASFDALDLSWDGSKLEGDVLDLVPWAVKEREGLWKWALLKDEEIRKSFDSERDGDGMVAISEPVFVVTVFGFG